MTGPGVISLTSLLALYLNSPVTGDNSQLKLNVFHTMPPARRM
uniref:Uncharacterized protein n=1 Tax=Salmonella enterica subsp. salamae TaxID=59202 RepID=I3W479_SALER|nr:hypothetical protein [Salmonella enterica subsp. salamae]